MIQRFEPDLNIWKKKKNPFDPFHSNDENMCFYNSKSKIPLGS